MTLATAKAAAVAHWSLDETSGTRADSVGSNDLTDNNTVGSASGKFSNAADFEETNSEYLSIADNTDLSVDGDVDFTMRCWVKLESKPGTGSQHGIMSKWTAGANREYGLNYHDGNDRFTFVVRSSGGTISAVDADTFGSPSTGTWYLLHCWHDSTADEIGIAVNAGTADTASHSDGILDNNADFTIGTRLQGNRHFDGLIDDAVFLKDYVLDSDERSDDYNDGTGVAFADWDATGGETEACSGTSAWTSDSTATLSCDVPLAATSSWGSDSTATLSCSVPLAGTSAWTSDSTATLSTDVPLSGTSLWTSDTTASMSSAVPLSATSSWTSGQSSQLGLKIAIGGTSSWTSGESAQLVKLVPIGSTSLWTSDSTGSLTIAGGFAGTSLWTSDSTGAITIAAGLAATSAWTSTTSGVLTFTANARIVDNGRAAHLDRRDIAAMLNGSPSVAPLDAHRIAAHLQARAIASKAHRRSTAAVTIQN